MAKFRGQLEFIAQAVDAALIRSAAAEQGIEVSDEELQKEADDFRAARQLYEAKKTEAWLAANHLSQEDWEIQLEDEILRRKTAAGGIAEQDRPVFCRKQKSPGRRDHFTHSGDG